MRRTTERLDIEGSLFRSFASAIVAPGEQRNVNKCATVRMPSVRYPVPAYASTVTWWGLSHDGAEVARHALRVPGGCLESMIATTRRGRPPRSVRFGP